MKNEEERKLAQKEANRKYYLKNKEKIIADTKAWAASHKHKVRRIKMKYRQKASSIQKRQTKASQNREAMKPVSRASHIKRTYGISVEEYDAMISAQDGKCFICGMVPNGKGSKGKLHLDHCHQSKKLRKMICGNCNTALGMVGDSTERLQSLIDYLNLFDEKTLQEKYSHVQYGYEFVKNDDNTYSLKRI